MHKNLGAGFLEKIYENALANEFNNNNILCEQQKPTAVKYKGEIVGEYFKDLLVDKKIILELKVAKKIVNIHETQLLHYLKATGMKAG